MKDYLGRTATFSAMEFLSRIRWRLSRRVSLLSDDQIRAQPEESAEHLTGYQPLRDYSQHGEQKIIVRFFEAFSGPYSPYFVDAGAYDGIVGSNTRGLFEAGWSGLLIEPNPAVFDRLRALYESNPRATCVRTALSNYVASSVEILLSEGPSDTPDAIKWQYAQVSTLNTKFAEVYERDFKYVYRKSAVEVTTLTELMRRHNVPPDLGFLSIDCEGEDPKVLEGLDMSEFKPRLLCVESDSQNRHVYTDFLTEKNYGYYANTAGNTFYILK